MKEIALDSRVAGFIQKVKLVRPEIWIVALHSRIVPEVTDARGSEGKKICPQRVFITARSARRLCAFPIYSQ
jgi:hypothetical protein